MSLKIRKAKENNIEGTTDDSEEKVWSQSNLTNLPLKKASLLQIV